MTDYAKCVLVPMERNPGVDGVREFCVSLYGYSLRELRGDPTPVVSVLAQRYSGYTPLLDMARDNSRAKVKRPIVWIEVEGRKKMYSIPALEYDYRGVAANALLY